MTKFSELGLSKPILDALQKQGYEKPTPIQAGVIPHMLKNRDVVGIAQTGTGKTAAFVLPILEKVRQLNGRPYPTFCHALIIAPTRELAAQIVDSVKAYSMRMNTSVALIVGGASAGKQISMLSRGVDIVVATPGRLLDHMGSGHINLNRTNMVVLDEADQMMDMGFIPAIREVMEALGDERQTLLLSATMPKPIRTLANDFLTNPAEVSVAEHSKPIERIDQRIYHVPRADKMKTLLDILKKGDVGSAIVFTKTRRGADKVNFQLQKSGLNSSAIHGEKTQKQRERTIRDFKNGKTSILVATDVAARGIDIDGVTHVINYELPMQPEPYVHRIGRTARAGESGIAISFADEHQRDELYAIERMIGSSFDIYGDGSMMQREPQRPKRSANPKKRKPRHKDRKPREDRDQKPRAPKAKDSKAKEHKAKDFKAKDHKSKANKDGGRTRYEGPDATSLDAPKKKRKPKKRDDRPTVERSFDDKPKGRVGKPKPKGKGKGRKPSPGERKRNSKYFGKRQKAKSKP